jgi:hypothetical protein
VKILTVSRLQNWYVECVVKQKEGDVGGLVLLSSIMIGLAISLSQWLLPGSVIAWFVSDSFIMETLRIIVLISLVALAVVREYYQNTYTRLADAAIGVLLLWTGTAYFMDNAQFIFDSLFMMAAGVSFAITAVQQSDEPEPLSSLGNKLFEALMPGALLAYYSHLYQPSRTLSERMRYRDDISETPHRLVLS